MTRRARARTSEIPANVADLFGVAAPSRGAILAKYDAAGTGRRMRGWNPPSSGPNRATIGLQKIRDRARDADRNDWTGAASIQRWTTNLVGIGIVPRTPRITTRTRKNLAAALWKQWARQSDADCVLDFYGQQTLAVRSWFLSGEVFARLRWRRPDAGLAVPLQVQLIEADYVPLLDADQHPEMPRGNRIRQGIEIDRIGRRVAYWMYREHPGDGSTSIDMSRLLRVPADDVLHVFEPKRPGQMRGVSEMATILARQRIVNDYDDAVLERQRLANLFVGFVTRTLPQPGDEDFDPITNLPLSYDAGGEGLASLEPGLLQELAAGEDIKFANPPEAGTMYHEYMRTQHLGTSSGMGLPYELMSGDIKEVSDRTLRVVINEFRRLAEQRQWQIIIPMFCQRVRAAWAIAASVAGHIPTSAVEEFADVDWAPHGWEYIHPVQDAQGKKVEVEAGFRSRSSVIAERGDDPEEVDDERAADRKREKRLDLLVEPAAPGRPKKADKPDEDGIDDEEYPAAP